MYGTDVMLPIEVGEPSAQKKLAKSELERRIYPSKARHFAKRYNMSENLRGQKKLCLREAHGKLGRPIHGSLKI